MSNELVQVDQYGTLLVISERGMPVYSARGLRVSLEPIEQSRQTKRTVNGGLVDLSQTPFHKYALEIAGSDLWAPPIAALYPGASLTIQWPDELYYTTGTGATAGRTGVTGSYRTDGAFSFYRPIFSVLVTEFSNEFDEWDATHSWTLRAEEV